MSAATSIPNYQNDGKIRQTEWTYTGASVKGVFEFLVELGTTEPSTIRRVHRWVRNCHLRPFQRDKAKSKRISKETGIPVTSGGFVQKVKQNAPSMPIAQRHYDSIQRPTDKFMAECVSLAIDVRMIIGSRFSGNAETGVHKRWCKVHNNHKARQWFREFSEQQIRDFANIVCLSLYERTGQEWRTVKVRQYAGSGSKRIHLTTFVIERIS